MAKKRIIERECNRLKLVRKYKSLREKNKDMFYKRETFKDRLKIHRELQKAPRNSAPVRLRNRCQISGRPRGYFRDFGLSRHFLREIAHQGVLPGIRKSSW